MLQAPIPKNEKERLISLHKLGLLDTNPEERFDLITRTATKIFHVPISTLTLVDETREWFKSVCGLDKKEGDRAISFCGHALLTDGVFVIPDTKKDKRFSDNPMVIGEPYIRFYAGVPIINADGQRIGVFCIKDIKPRSFSKDDKKILIGLTAWAELEINSRNLNLAIKERMKGEKKIIEEKNKNEAILFSISDAVMACDNDGQIMMFNAAAEEISGSSAKKAVGHHYSQSLKFIREGNEKTSDDPINEIIKKGRWKKMENRILLIAKDGHKIPVINSVAPIKNAQNEIMGYVLVFRDVTKEREADKAKSEFVSLASHQLRTPLTGIEWTLELLSKKQKLSVQGKRYLEDARFSAHRLSELIQFLLNVSHIESGKLKVTPEPMELVQFVALYVSEHQILAKKRNLSLSFEDHPKTLLAVTDKNLLTCILQNLLSNAINYTPLGGNVTVTLKRKGAHALLCVKDTGIGIPKKDQGRIFEKFIRADNANTINTTGSGLGLYIAAQSTKLLDGKIWFESKEGIGSTFMVEFPLTSKSLAGEKVLTLMR